MSGEEHLTRLTGRSGGPPCDNDDCPNVYATAQGTFVFQGDVYRGFAAPDREALVEIPESVPREAVHALGW
ncbi:MULTISPECIES: hypothetical protein [Streptomyces]|uniref:hypothetical protein n=1 Tax=Streptomyces TaxID=1883 RepID=UPI00163D135C|nr:MULTISPECIES: hypothetical protein [Streptomyces]MBC2879188.1 hypothetical protein [Streptomyces sp. TYQ1024]UBI38540.1 hypothetical protein K7I03_20120 [Streptomyces mobaraensis]UKW31124.1 hypothetical protein MCU78_20075 [Streptomyces sp. TYQ1024]